MASDSSFLLLPSEVRLQIYHSYLMIGAEEGYIFDFGSGKLRTAPRHEPIDLSLMYTCRLVSSEMRGLALSLHTVTFSTICSEDLQFRARRFDFLLIDGVYSCQWRVFARLSSCLDPPKAEDVVRRFPSISPALRCLMQERWSDRLLRMLRDFCGEAPSFFREVVAYTARLVAADSDSLERLRNALGSRRSLDSIRAIYNLCPEPWAIPTEHQLHSMAQVLSDRWPAVNEHCEPDRGKYRFSAAAAAIHFLRSIPESRSQMRRILLLEDYDAVGSSSCHARGLIPFCQENPRLRIERRVNLWRNIFLTVHGIVRNKEDRVFSQRSRRKMWADDITRPIAEWMVEASILRRAGMPQDAFTLVLDGEEIPERSSEIFRAVVQRDAAWQVALEQQFALSRQNNESFLKMKNRWGYHFTGFPQLLGDLTNNKTTSCIRCTFDPGETWDVAKLIEDHPGMFDDGNIVGLWHRSGVMYDTSPPLPKWRDLLLENLFPRPDGGVDSDVESWDEDGEEDSDEEAEEDSNEESDVDSDEPE